MKTAVMQSNCQFPVILVTEAHHQFSTYEPIGTKTKFWFKHEEFDRCLYKEVKEKHLGEDWAEKVASELCELLGLPHATYHLAKNWEGNRGVVSPYFVQKSGTLVLGNDILTPIVPDYPTGATYGNRQHTIDIVLGVIKNDNVNLPIGWTPLSEIQKAVEVFIGYLLLDAWIGNVDRHHQNWGFIQNKVAHTSVETLHLAPTYDHASSLGRELSDEKRQKLSLEAYANKCRSAFYSSVEDKKCLKTFDVFHRVALSYPQAANIWLERLKHISRENTSLIFSKIPREYISTIAVEFAQKILEFNQHRLLTLRESIK